MYTHYPDNVPVNCMAQPYIMHVMVRVPPGPQTPLISIHNLTMYTHYPDNVPVNCMAQPYIMHVIVRSRKEERRGADRLIPTQFWKGKKGFLFPYQYLQVRYGEQSYYNDWVDIIYFPLHHPACFFPPPPKKMLSPSQN